MKKFLSMLLTLALMLSVCAVPALAADDDDGGDVTPRDTNYFTTQPHTTLKFSEIQYQYIDPDPLMAEFDAVYEFAQDPAKFDLFQERFISAKNLMYKMYANWLLLSIETDHDTTDEWANEEYLRVYDDLDLTFIKFNGLVRDVLRLDNAASDWLKSMLTEEDVEDYLGYEEPSDEERALDMRNMELEQEFETVDHTVYTTTIDGVEYDADGVYYAFMRDGTITLEQYLEGCHECYGAYGDLYLEMIDVRNQIAQLNGYANYAEYAYAEVYNRDYTVQEIDAFRTAVKKYLAPQIHSFGDYRSSVDVDEIPLDPSEYSGDGMFDTLAPYFASMSDELLESMRAMSDGGFYDIDMLPQKANRGYSMMLPYYNMPFYYNYPDGSVQDLLTTIHEMGHNNKSYWSPNDWTDTSPSSNKDLAEVHSQGLELLMTHYYPELFGDQADAMQAYEAYNILSSIIQGCLHDEIQCYAYSTPGVTFDMICQKYRQLAEEYGNVGSDDPRPEMYGWTSVHHTFNSPMYYISYATSAAGAFAFWNEAQDDFMSAVDQYLAFCAQSATCGFEETFANVGMQSPISPSYVKDLAKTLHDKLFHLGSFTDVYTDDWAVAYIDWVTYYGMMDGVSEDSFAPTAAASRAVTMTSIARYAQLLGVDESSDELFTLDEGIAWAIAAEISDGTNPDGTLTREQAAVMLAHFAELLGVEVVAEGDLSDFPDAASVSDWAVDTLTWAVENGLIGGTGEGLLNPQGVITRAELATLLNRFITLLY